MNDSPKPRRWFQLHLSTLLVLTLVAGALVWANTAVRERTGAVNASNGVVVTLVPERGWPQNAIVGPERYVPEAEGWGPSLDGEVEVRPWSFGVNCVTGMLLAGTIGVLWEALMRRRERCQP